MKTPLNETEKEVLAGITIATGEIVKGQGFLILKEPLLHALQRKALERIRKEAPKIVEQALERKAKE